MPKTYPAISFAATSLRDVQKRHAGPPLQLPSPAGAAENSSKDSANITKDAQDW
jgi:hypothetical protein